MPLRRMGRPGLVGLAARTAVVAGTATAVSGGMQRRQQGKAQDQYEQEQYQAAQQQAQIDAAAQAAAAQYAQPQHAVRSAAARRLRPPGRRRHRHRRGDPEARGAQGRRHAG